MGRILLPFIAVIICSCAAQMVNKPGGSVQSPYAPTNEMGRTGVVKYLNQGIDAIREERRKDAYRQMYNSCGGSYKIVAEGPRLEGGSVIFAPQSLPQ